MISGSATCQESGWLFGSVFVATKQPRCCHSHTHTQKHHLSRMPVKGSGSSYQIRERQTRRHRMTGWKREECEKTDEKLWEDRNRWCVWLEGGLQLCVYPAPGKTESSQLRWQSRRGLWWHTALATGCVGTRSEGAWCFSCGACACVFVCARFVTS